MTREVVISGEARTQCPHVVYIPDSYIVDVVGNSHQAELHAEIRQWCEDNTRAKFGLDYLWFWQKQGAGQRWIIRFENENDAIFFKLRWT